MKLKLKLKSALPPAGGFLSPLKLLKSYLRELRGLTLDKEAYPKHQLYFLNSGKSALYLFFLALKKEKPQFQEIGVSAYTCPDVALGAIKAGFKIRLLDVEEARPTLSLSRERVEGLDVVILSNLYGLLDEISDDLGLLVVDDLCQSALSKQGKKSNELKKNRIGILSFSRGKAFSGAGGGVLLVPKTKPELNDRVQTIFEQLPQAGIFSSLGYFIKNALLWLLEKPFFYFWVLKIPGLKLGETKVDFDFEFQKGHRFSPAILNSFLSEQSAKSKMLSHQAALYQEFLLKKTKVKLCFDPLSLKNLVPIRFPIYCLNREEQIKGLACLKEKGITFSYPEPITKYFNQDSFSEKSENCPQALNFAKNVLTLPMGPAVSDEDIKRLVESFE